MYCRRLTQLTMVISCVFCASHVVYASEKMVTCTSIQQKDLEALMYRAAQSKDMKTLKTSYQCYEKVEKKDPLLMLLIQAVIQENKGQYAQAQAHYKKVLKYAPSLYRVQYTLGSLLYADYKNKEAHQLFQNIRHNTKASDTYRKYAGDYLAAIDRREKFDMSFNANFVVNKNVNNASPIKTIENTGFVKNKDMLPQKAYGIAASFSIGKNTNIIDSHYIDVSNSGSGTIYFGDKKEFNEFNNRTNIGYRYQDRKKMISIAPFFTYQMYGNKSYAYLGGLRFQYKYTFNDKVRFSHVTEVSGTQYAEEKNRKSSTLLLSNSVIWYPTNSQYVTVGLSHTFSKSTIKHYGYNEHALSVGWGMTAGKGFHVDISARISGKKFKDKAWLGHIIKLNKIRSDRNYALDFTFYHKKLQWRGFIPKLNVELRKQVSNIPSMYSHAENHVYLSVDRDF